MLTRSVLVQGIGWWTPYGAGWPAARGALAGGDLPQGPALRPTTTLLAANERRRAPEAVLMALQVAAEACAAAGVDPSAVASVFASAHGDLAIVDGLCRTLATEPRLLSPLRFHHSVHNAASGYWAIGTGNRRASSALAGAGHSFSAGLLEAACQCAADAQPVLLVAADTEAPEGPLRSVNRSRGQLALALLLAPPGTGPGRALHWRLQPVAAAAPPLRSALAQRLAGNAAADALPLFEALADSASTELTLPLGGHQSLASTLDPA